MPMVRVAGFLRNFRVIVPTNYAASQSGYGYPLIMVLHAEHENPLTMAARWLGIDNNVTVDELTYSDQFILVFPEGLSVSSVGLMEGVLGIANNPGNANPITEDRSWFTGAGGRAQRQLFGPQLVYDSAGRVVDDPDLQFIDQVLELMLAHYQVDKRRIFATGFSSGGSMCYRLASLRPKMFAAIAPVGGSIGGRQRKGAALEVNLPPATGRAPLFQISTTKDESRNKYGLERLLRTVAYGDDAPAFHLLRREMPLAASVQTWAATSSPPHVQALPGGSELRTWPHTDVSWLVIPSANDIPEWPPGVSQWIYQFFKGLL